MLSWAQSVLDDPDRTGCRVHPEVKGRPAVRIDGQRLLLTRVILIRAGHPWHPPLGYNVLHSCDNPLCCAPWHLRWGTQAENLKDSITRRRTPQQRHRDLVAWCEEQGLAVPEDLKPNAARH